MKKIISSIIGRDDGSFDPNGRITREEAAKILEKIAALYMKTSYDTDEFNDHNQISGWAKGGAYW